MGLQLRHAAEEPGFVPEKLLRRADLRVRVRFAQRDHDGGTVKTLGDSSGDDPDDAGVSVAAREHKRGRVFVFIVDHFERFAHHAPFEFLTRRVQIVDERRQFVRALGDVGDEEFDAEHREPHLPRARQRRGVAEQRFRVEPVRLIFLVLQRVFVEDFAPRGVEPRRERVADVFAGDLFVGIGDRDFDEPLEDFKEYM